MSDDLRNQVLRYLASDIRNSDWHLQYFSFVRNAKLAVRLGEEFISARYVYKFFEGIAASDWLLRAQVRVQIMMYASIYEAVIHHVLFELLLNDPKVISLTEYPTKKIISIPEEHRQTLERYLAHDGRTIVPTYEGIGRTDESKVRFDRKATCAYELGFIEKWLKEDLIEIYEARNAIHLHAEIRKSLDYQIDLSRTAYRRLQPFKEQVSKRLDKLGL